MEPGDKGAGAELAGLEAIARPLLDLMNMVTGLESTYLTEIDWENYTQRVLMSENRGPMQIPEGLTVDFGGSLCKQAFDANRPVLTNVQQTYPELKAVQDLGIDTYIGIPVVTPDDRVVGTLCGATSRSTEIDPDAVEILKLFALLISERWELDRNSKLLSRRAELAEQRVKERATFLALAEHKLKSPLTVIRGWAEELNDSWDTMSEEARRKGAGVILRSSEQLATQVNDLLEEARNEVVATSLTMKRANIVPVIDRVVDELQASCSKHSLIADVPEELTATVDETALWHALVHLVENAIKYSPDGGKITVSGRPQGGAVCVEVSDEGPGIPTDIDIFEPFVRKDGSQKVEGSGLGLHVVRTLMHSMHGDVVARRNEDGPGSTFTLNLCP